MTWIFCVAFAALGISGSVMSSGVTYISELFDVRVDQSGLFISVHTVGIIVTTLGMGWLLDKYNTRSVLWLGAAALAIGNAVMFFAASATVAFIAMLFIGLGFGAILVSGNIVAVRLNPTNGTKALTLVSVFFGVGGIIGPQVVNIAVAMGRITNAHLFIAIVMLILIPFLRMIRLEPPAKLLGIDNTRVPMIPSASLGILVLFGVYLCLYTGAEIGFASWIFTEMNVAANLPEAFAASFVSIFWAGIMAGRLVGGFVIQRFSGEKVLIIATIALSITQALLVFLPPSAVLGVLCTFSFGFFAGPIFPIVISMIQAQFPAAGGTISGILMAIGNIGVMTIPWLQGQIGGGLNGGMQIPLIAILIITGLSFLLSYNNNRAEKAVA